MGLREEIAKVRLARARLDVTRAKLNKLDSDRAKVEKMRETGRLAPASEPERSPRRRRGFRLD